MSLTHRPINGIHETSQATLLKADSIPTESIEPLKSAEPDAIEINTDQNPVSNDIEMKMNDNNTGKNGIDTYKDHVNTDNDAINTAKKGIDSDKNTNLDKNDVNLANNEDNMRKSDSNTSKSDDEITRNGAHTPVSKSGSCEPETPKGDHVINGLDNGAKATEDTKDEKDFWGLSLKKKKKKKAVKGLTAESLQEGVAVKP
ncbi:hypothetical protein TrVFT333_009459 [Trichoderma virens FT-333]|nr:hypothetical protein TrVFT333_009459 [Trichoderma virens FT-333]